VFAVSVSIGSDTDTDVCHHTTEGIPVFAVSVSIGSDTDPDVCHDTTEGIPVFAVSVSIGSDTDTDVCHRTTEGIPVFAISLALAQFQCKEVNDQQCSSFQVASGLIIALTALGTIGTMLMQNQIFNTEMSDTNLWLNAVRVAFSNRNVHSRTPLVPTLETLPYSCPLEALPYM
jgi:putative aminopeptidase FrvX